MGIAIEDEADDEGKFVADICADADAEPDAEADWKPAACAGPAGGFTGGCGGETGIPIGIGSVDGATGSGTGRAGGVTGRPGAATGNAGTPAGGATGTPGGATGKAGGMTGVLGGLMGSDGVAGICTGIPIGRAGALGALGALGAPGAGAGAPGGWSRVIRPNGLPLVLVRPETPDGMLTKRALGVAEALGALPITGNAESAPVGSTPVGSAPVGSAPTMLLRTPEGSALTTSCKLAPTGSDDATLVTSASSFETWSVPRMDAAEAPSAILRPNIARTLSSKPPTIGRPSTNCRTASS